MAREVEKEYVETGKVRLVYVDFIVKGEPGVLAAEAAHCAGEQDAYWAYHDLLFDQQFEKEITSENLKGYAEELGLDTESFAQCLDENRYRELVIGLTQEGRRIGLQGTPSFLVNEQFIPGLPDFEQMKQIIEEELAKAAEAGTNTPTPTTAP
ncbi:MAG: hypothetical protein D6791_02990 [Chloroflexi bacterium]|nr:MAG: hypothetical protein D6791_02990 [Chloroflexota bacterium]